MKALCQEEERHGLRIAPLIDIVFLLLIFFLVATTFYESEKDITIKLAEATEGAEREKVIRLVVPGLSEERRKQLAARVKEMAEDAKVAVRNVRRDANKALDRLKRDSAIGEDECDSCKEEVQGFTGQHEERIVELLEKKTADIMKV